MSLRDRFSAFSLHATLLGMLIMVELPVHLIGMEPQASGDKFVWRRVRFVYRYMSVDKRKPVQ